MLVSLAPSLYFIYRQISGPLLLGTLAEVAVDRGWAGTDQVKPRTTDMTPNKAHLLEAGKDLLHRFCLLNQLEPPPIQVYEKGTWRFDACAYYRPTAIHIAPHRCAHIGTAGRSWSYPGYVIDRTPYGVIQHELGHHVDRLLSGSKGSYGGDFSSTLRAGTKEEKITNYCPNDWEWFAEIFRLFVTNSDLLKLIRPRTHEELASRFTPAVDAPWRDVLKDAPQRTIEMASRK